VALTPEDRTDFRASVVALLDARSPVARSCLVADSEPGFDSALWEEIGELGWPGLLVPEELGGVGAGMTEVCMVSEQLGAHLTPGPFVPSAVLAVGALVDARERALRADALLRSAAMGKTIGTVALLDRMPADDAERLHVRASGDAWLLKGVLREVLHAEAAAFVVAPVIVGGRDALAAIDLREVAHDRYAEGLVDRTRRVDRLRFDDALAASDCIIVEGDAAVAVMERMRARAVLALAADAVGGARAVHEEAVAYAKERIQFGRPIGSFQAVKHKLADRYVDVLAADAALAQACDRFDAGGDHRAMVLAAGYRALTGFARVAGDAIQVHGGIGFSWEHFCHRYFKRAWLNRTLYGGDERLLDDFAEQMPATRIPVPDLAMRYESYLEA
jgi:alkylation response protein AidB-like acyl-CoA dehydrogenase